MPEAAVVVEADRPAVGLVDGFAGPRHGVVTYDLDGGGLVADELGEQGVDDVVHAGGEDDDLFRGEAA